MRACADVHDTTQSTVRSTVFGERQWNRPENAALKDKGKGTDACPRHHPALQLARLAHLVAWIESDVPSRAVSWILRVVRLSTVLWEARSTGMDTPAIARKGMPDRLLGHFHPCRSVRSERTDRQNCVPDIATLLKSHTFLHAFILSSGAMMLLNHFRGVPG